MDAPGSKPHCLQLNSLRRCHLSITEFMKAPSIAGLRLASPPLFQKARSHTEISVSSTHLGVTAKRRDRVYVELISYGVMA